MRRKNMKQTIVLCVTWVALICTGCTDFLERDHPTGVTDDDFWKTMNECTNALNVIKVGRLSGCISYNDPGLGLVHLEGATDNMYFMSNFYQQIVNLGNGTATPTSGAILQQVWEGDYRYIHKCNRFLKFVDNAYFTDEAERARMKAEVKVWRAWYHMQLLLYYGRNDGIPVVDDILNPEDIYRPRNTVDECLAFINKELDDVINSSDLPFVWDEGRKDRMSISIALTLKMDINLQFKRYDEALAAAQQIIDSGQFELYYSEAKDSSLGKNFRDLFRYEGEQNKERILFTVDGLKENWFRHMGTPLGGQGTAAVLKSLVDEFETIDGHAIQSLPADEREKYERTPLYKPRDPRLYVTVMLPGDSTSLSYYTYTPFDEGSGDYVGKTGASRSGYMLKKFIDEQDRPTCEGNLDFMLYRYAEVLLTYVECLVETGDWQNPKVAEYINMIRKRADMPPMDKSTYNTQEKVRELYRRERRVELAFEGKRYDDIRRWGIGQQVMTGSIYGAWNPTTNAFVTIEERACSFPKYDSWPLPQTEVTSNPNITQPTGW